jgi:hypothetical protein
MKNKRIVLPSRIRRVPKQFSWIDHNLVRKKYICDIPAQSLALYLFLVTVSDSEGISYYSIASINKYLGLEVKVLEKARTVLCNKGLVAYSNPFYQVLSLQNESAILPCGINEKEKVIRNNSSVESAGAILRKYIGVVND